MARRGLGADRAPAPRRVHRMRAFSMIGTWVFVLMFLWGPVFMGSPIFAVPAALATFATLASMRASRLATGPDAQTLAPGDLRAATKARPVEVTASALAGVTTRGGSIHRGVLRVADKRVSFESDDDIVFDVPITKIALTAMPSFWRPQLDLDTEAGPHTIRFMPIWDVGATFVGPIIAGEWWAQLRELGAK